MTPKVTHTHTLMDMRTDLIAVPHASLRNPNPEKPGEVHQLQKKRRANERQGDDVRAKGQKRRH